MNDFTWARDSWVLMFLFMRVNMISKTEVDLFSDFVKLKYSVFAVAHSSHAPEIVVKASLGAVVAM